MADGAGSDEIQRNAASLAIDESFPRRNRLLTARQFSAVFERRSARRGRFFHLLAATPVQPVVGSSTARLGLVIPKKMLKTAVHRNLLKRLGREIFRRQRGGLEVRDYVLRLAIRLDPARQPLNRAALASDIAGLFASFCLDRRTAAGQPAC